MMFLDWMLARFSRWRRARGGRWATVTGFLYGRRWICVGPLCVERVDEDYEDESGKLVRRAMQAAYRLEQKSQETKR